MGVMGGSWGAHGAPGGAWAPMGPPWGMGAPWGLLLKSVSLIKWNVLELNDWIVTGLDRARRKSYTIDCRINLRAMGKIYMFNKCVVKEIQIWHMLTNA